MSTEKKQVLSDDMILPLSTASTEKGEKGKTAVYLSFPSETEQETQTKKASLVQEVTQRSTNTSLGMMLHLTCANKDFLLSLQVLTQLESAPVSVCSTSLCHTDIP